MALIPDFYGIIWVIVISINQVVQKCHDLNPATFHQIVPGINSSDHPLAPNMAGKRCRSRISPLKWQVFRESPSHLWLPKSWQLCQTMKTADDSVVLHLVSLKWVPRVGALNNHQTASFFDILLNTNPALVACSISHKHPPCGFAQPSWGNSKKYILIFEQPG